MSDELKPCPFCPDGGEPEINYGCGGSKAYVRCHGCGIFSPSFDKKKDAVAYWNTRYERTCRYEHIEGTWYKTSCGERYDGVVPPNCCQKCGAKVVR